MNDDPDNYKPKSKEIPSREILDEELREILGKYPDNYKPKYKEVPASEILDKILKGEQVVYYHAIISGDLDVCKLDLPKENGKHIIKSSLKLRSSIIQGHIDFENICFDEEVDLILSQVEGWANFSGAEFRKSAHFLAIKFQGETHFKETVFYESVGFVEAIFGLEPPNPPMAADFAGAKFKNVGYFMESKFNGDSYFGGCQFNNMANFSNSRFTKNANFIRAKFGNNVYFIGSHFGSDTYFVQAQFENVYFKRAQFDGEVLTFKGANFSLSICQEDACRRAKNVLAKAGNREEEEYHFYREMEGKRIRKGIRDGSGIGLRYLTLKTDTWSFWRFLWYDVIEYIFVQGMFGYGVHPKRLMMSWGAIVLAFGFFYWYGDGIIGTTDWLDYIKVSFATAIAPGYIAAIINPGSAGYRLIPAYQIVAMIETIVGTFLWAGFIATFAKKYMR